MVTYSPSNHHLADSLASRAAAGPWLAGLPGLVAVASNPGGEGANIQVTYLERVSGGKHPGVEVARRILGSFQDPKGYRSLLHSCQVAPFLKGLPLFKGFLAKSHIFAPFLPLFLY